MTENINFEDIPKHNISRQASNHMLKVMYDQDEKGIKKYGEPLNPFSQYNWDAMADEELADYLKYLQCSRIIKDRAIQTLRTGLASNDPKRFIQAALDLLTVEGTGK